MRENITTRFLNLFRKRRKTVAPPEGSLFFHEDDYCQIELAPVENLSFFMGESEKINDLAEKSFDGTGYTDMYVRQGERVKLEERKISPVDLEEFIKTTRLPKAPAVTTGYGTTSHEIAMSTIGYGKGYSAIYFDLKDDIVLHIWLTNHFSLDQEKLLDCLFQIGNKWNLLLMDWEESMAVDLSDKTSIKNYLDR